MIARGRHARVAVLALAAVGAVPSFAGCYYRPALFADHEIIDAVEDDRPIPLPSVRTFDEREQVSDIYLRRPLFDFVHPVDFPTGGDVNAMDEVAASTWYEPTATAKWGALVAQAAPPTPPLVAIDEDPATDEEALVVRDARGLRYELIADPAGRPGLRTGADVVAGHLLRGLGLHAPMSWIVTVAPSALVAPAERTIERVRAWSQGKAVLANGGRRVSATLWPMGIDVGVCNDFNTRSDDPNDKIDHHDRRTLRAMKVFGAWLGWSGFGVRNTRDVYVGVPGEGHLVHTFVGLSRALGTMDLLDRPTRDERGGGVFFNLVTLGLSPAKTTPARRSPFPSLGYLPTTLAAAAYDVSPPYSPFVRFTPPDEYWAAKRLLDTGYESLVAAVAAARLPDDASHRLSETLLSRRHVLVAHGMSVVSPLDPAATSGRSVWLRDRAIAAGLIGPNDTRYEIAFLDNDGRARAPSVRLDATGPLTAVAIPPELSGLVVLHVWVIRDGAAAPRPCDVHVIAKDATTRVIGVRH